MNRKRRHSSGVCIRSALTFALGLVIIAPPPGLQSTALGATEQRGLLARPDDVSLKTDADLEVRDDPAAPSDEVDVEPAIAAANATMDALDPSQWVIEDLANALGSEPEAAFGFVRDSIGFEPYAGLLRGADATLAARGGNALDRAMLLKGLLDQMGRTTRLAFADLDAATTARLAERVRLPVPVPIQSARDLALGPDFLDSMAQRARRDYAKLRLGLGDLLSSAASTDQDVTPDLQRHAWVQVLQDDVWVDYDPSFLDARPGSPLVPASQTLDQVPPEALHAVTLRVVAETLTDGSAVESLLLEHRLPAADAARDQILLAFGGEGGGAGIGLLGGGGSPTSFMPVLLVNGEPLVGQAISPAGSEGGDDGGLGGLDVFGGGGGGGSGDLTGLFLDVIRSVPGQADEIRRHVLLDRVPAADRATGTIRSEALAPLGEPDAVPPVFGGIHHVMVSVGGSDILAYASARGYAAYVAATELLAEGASQRIPLRAVLWPQTIMNAALVIGSEHVVVDALAAEDLRAVVSRPRVYIVSMLPEPGVPAGVAVETDLIFDDVGIVTSPDAAPAELAKAQVWYGALEAALETEWAIRLAPALGVGADMIAAVSIGGDRPLEVLLPSDAATLTPDAPRALRAALVDGKVALAAEPRASAGWWVIDPATGETSTLLASGLHSVKIPPVNPGFPGGGQRNPNPKPIPKPKPTPQPPKKPDRKLPNGWDGKDGFDDAKKSSRPGEEYSLLLGIIGAAATASGETYIPALTGVIGASADSMADIWVGG